MKRTARPETVRIATLATLALSLAALTAPACGGDDNPKPSSSSSSSTTSSGTGGAATTSTPGTGGTGTGGAATTSSTGTGGAATTSSTGTGGGDAGQSCTGTDGCYACPPQTTSEFLNGCTNAQCSPFDNVARLPLYNNGNLPSLP